MGIAKVFNVVKGIYNLIKTLIGLAVLGVVGYFFFLNQKAEYEAEQYAEEQRELVSEIQESLQGQGIEDPDALRIEYLKGCPYKRYKLIEGDAVELCESYADALLARSLERGLSLDTYGELSFQVCARDIEEGYDPEEYCEREYAIEEAKVDAIKVSLCDFDSAHLFDNEYEEHITKRGETVYYYFEEDVNCATKQMVGYDDERFFETWYDEDEDWPRILDRMWESIDERGNDAAIAILDRHDFGEDPAVDRQLLTEFLYDDYVDYLAAVLERNGGQVNFDDEYYRQPLSIAISNESPAVAMLLLEAGASPTSPNEYGQPPIVAAAEYGMLDIVRELVARGADVDGQIGADVADFAAPLASAAYSGHSETAFWLLENGAGVRPDDPEQYPDFREGRVIEQAAYGGDIALFEAVVKRGARTSDTYELVGNAILGGNAEMLASVFDAGYTIDDTSMHETYFEYVVNVVDEDDEEIYRIEEGVRMFEILLDNGLNLVEYPDEAASTGYMAVRNYAPNAVQSPRDERAEFQREQRVRFVTRVIDELVAAGVDVNARSDGRTMLMAAADSGNAAIARHLLDKGADPALTNDDGATALDIAISEGRRLGSVWKDDRPFVHERFADTVVTLGGSADMLEPEATAATN